MSRKDYIKFANLLNRFQVELDDDAFSGLVDGMVEILREDNDRFDVYRFKSACYRTEKA